MNIHFPTALKEIERLEAENKLLKKEICDYQESLVKGKYVFQEMEAEITAKDAELEQFKIKYNVDLASTDLHYSDWI